MNAKESSAHLDSGASLSFFEKPSNVRRLTWGLVVVCVLLVAADLFYTNPHPHFEPIETSLGFQAWFGFVSFTVVVFLGKLLRKIIMRQEDYYQSPVLGDASARDPAGGLISDTPRGRRSKKGKRE